MLARRLIDLVLDSPPRTALLSADTRAIGAVSAAAMRYTCAIAVLAFCAACGSNAASPTRPSPAAAVSSTRTFTMFGVVYDTIGRPVPGATVQVVSEARKDATVLADDRGRFTFAEPFDGSVRLRASKTGYLDDTREITFTAMQNRSFTPYFQLQSDGPIVSLAGPLRLRFEIDRACADAVPPAFWTREYSAMVPRHSTFAVFRLDGGAFAPGPVGSYEGGSTVYASFFGQEAQFYLEDPPLVEVLNDGARFSIYGHSSGVIDGAETSWPLRGWFSYCPVNEYDCDTCQSASHVLTLIRD